MTDRPGFYSFTLTEDHLKLMRRTYVTWDGSAYEGAPAVSIKRPYGNSDVPGDIIEILGWDDVYDEDEGYSKDAIERALTVHLETAYALQVVLSTQSFVPGKYVTTRMYDVTSWVLDPADSTIN